MDVEELKKCLDLLPSDARFILLMCSLIDNDYKINLLTQRVKTLEGNLATMRLRLSNLEKNIKKCN